MKAGTIIHYIGDDRAYKEVLKLQIPSWYPLEFDYDIYGIVLNNRASSYSDIQTYDCRIIFSYRDESVIVHDIMNFYEFELEVVNEVDNQR